RPGTSPHALRIPPHGGHPALRVMRGGCRSPLAVSGFRLRARLGFSIPSSPRPARNYPRFWIRHPSFGRPRDLNPPDHHAAPRTLWTFPTPWPAEPVPRGLLVGLQRPPIRVSRVALASSCGVPSSRTPAGPSTGSWVIPLTVTAVAFPCRGGGSAPALFRFRGLLDVHVSYGPHAR